MDKTTAFLKGKKLTDEVIDKALRVDLAERFASMAEFAAALERVP